MIFLDLLRFITWVWFSVIWECQTLSPTPLPLSLYTYLCCYLFTYFGFLWFCLSGFLLCWHLPKECSFGVLVLGLMLGTDVENSLIVLHISSVRFFLLILKFWLFSWSLLALSHIPECPITGLCPLLFFSFGGLHWTIWNSETHFHPCLVFFTKPSTIWYFYFLLSLILIPLLTFTICVCMLSSSSITFFCVMIRVDFKRYLQCPCFIRCFLFFHIMVFFSVSLCGF